jgi:hypothetical protein
MIHPPFFSKTKNTKINLKKSKTKKLTMTIKNLNINNSNLFSLISIKINRKKYLIIPIKFQPPNPLSKHIIYPLEQSEILKINLISLPLKNKSYKLILKFKIMDLKKIWIKRSKSSNKNLQYF